jgi:hypothetical protein
MSKAGREASRTEACPVHMVEEIASAYLIQAEGDTSLALRQAIGDTLADLFEMERRTRRAERLISRGLARARSAQDTNG